jgi:hypothetical protein
VNLRHPSALAARAVTSKSRTAMAVSKSVPVGRERGETTTLAISGTTTFHRGMGR